MPDKGFLGTDPPSRREGPVQFEKDKAEDDDPFGLGQLLKSAKEGKKRGAEEERERESKRRK